uniref:Uncharacterized protein n=1 Tax=Rhizophora mucronata TaxID=61149 RepID=A0A2P2P3V3_RHIMU
MPPVPSPLPARVTFSGLPCLPLLPGFPATPESFPSPVEGCEKIDPNNPLEDDEGEEESLGPNR